MREIIIFLYYYSVIGYTWLSSICVKNRSKFFQCIYTYERSILLIIRKKIKNKKRDNKKRKRKKNETRKREKTEKRGRSIDKYKILFKGEKKRKLRITTPPDKFVDSSSSSYLCPLSWLIAMFLRPGSHIFVHREMVGPSFAVNKSCFVIDNNSRLIARTDIDRPLIRCCNPRRSYTETMNKTMNIHVRSNFYKAPNDGAYPLVRLVYSPPRLLYIRCHRYS